MSPNSAGHTSGPGKPSDGNALFTVGPVLALQLAGKARSIKVSPTEVALEFVLVLVRVGMGSACRDWDYFSSHGITFEVVSTYLDPCIHEAYVYRRLGVFVAVHGAARNE